MVLKKPRVFQAFHFLSASINLRPTRGQTFMLLAVALTHLADPDNAKSAYEQAINLDVKDPAVPLNFAVFLCNRNEIDEAKNMLNMFELRVQKLRSSPGLDADPDVLQSASNLAEKLEYSLTISLPEPKASKSRRGSSTSEISTKPLGKRRSAALKSAKAAVKAQYGDGKDPDKDDIRVKSDMDPNSEE